VLKFSGHVTTDGYCVTTDGAFSAIIVASFGALNDAIRYCENMTENTSTQDVHYAIESRLDNEIVYVF